MAAAKEGGMILYGRGDIGATFFPRNSSSMAAAKEGGMILEGLDSTVQVRWEKKES
jgi:hypothetical protein